MKIIFKNGTKVRVSQKIANLIADAMKDTKPNDYGIISLSAIGSDDVIIAVSLADIIAII